MAYANAKRICPPPTNIKEYVFRRKMMGVDTQIRFLGRIFFTKKIEESMLVITKGK